MKKLPAYSFDEQTLKNAISYYSAKDRPREPELKEKHILSIAEILKKESPLLAKSISDSMGLELTYEFGYEDIAYVLKTYEELKEHLGENVEHLFLETPSGVEIFVEIKNGLKDLREIKKTIDDLLEPMALKIRITALLPKNDPLLSEAQINEAMTTLLGCGKEDLDLSKFSYEGIGLNEY